MQRFTIILALLLAVPFAAVADDTAEPRFVEGEHYIKLDDARSTNAGEGEVEVIEFFWYGCSHCFATERHVQQWLESKPENVKFLRVPATVNRGWVPLARTFYAAEQLGVIHEMHDALFAAIHRERRPMGDMEAVAGLFEEKAGIDPEQFRKAFESFQVGMKLKQADSLARAYPLRGVPTFVIDGQYLTSAGMAGSYERLLDVTRYLSEKELATRQSGAMAAAEAE